MGHQCGRATANPPHSGEAEPKPAIGSPLHLSGTWNLEEAEHVGTVFLKDGAPDFGAIGLHNPAHPVAKAGNQAMVSVELGGRDEAILQPLNHRYIGNYEVAPVYTSDAEDAQITAICQRGHQGGTVGMVVLQEPDAADGMGCGTGVHDQACSGPCSFPWIVATASSTGRLWRTLSHGRQQKTLPCFTLWDGTCNLKLALLFMDVLL